MFPSPLAVKICRGIGTIVVCLSFLSEAVAATTAPKRPSATAQKSSATTNDPRKSSGGHHFLWKILNVPQPFYILGSVHALRPRDYPLPKVIDQAIRECNNFAFELYSDEVRKEPNFYKRFRDAARYLRKEGVQ